MTIPNNVYISVYSDSKRPNNDTNNFLLFGSYYSATAETIRNSGATGNAVLGATVNTYRDDLSFSLDGTPWAGQGALVPPTGSLDILPGVQHVWVMGYAVTGVNTIGTGYIQLVDDGYGSPVGRLEVHKAEI